MLRPKVAGALAVAALALIAWGCAEPMGGERQGVAGGVDPKAKEILKQMSATLAGAKSLAFTVEVAMDERLPTGGLVQTLRTSRIVAVRPDHLSIRTESAAARWAANYDGRALALLSLGKNVYAEEPCHGTNAQMLDHMADEYGLTMPMVDLLVDKVYDSMTANITSARYLGIHLVGDHKCHHLAMSQDTIDWQIWIDAGEKPLPRKLVITYKLESDKPQYEAMLDEWDLDAKPAADAFKFVAPADAKKVSMLELLGQRRGGQS
jgi:hypothetical protein